MKIITLFAILFFAAIQNGFTTVADTPDENKYIAVVTPELILVNQLGFKPLSEKLHYCVLKPVSSKLLIAKAVRLFLPANRAL